MHTVRLRIVGAAIAVGALVSLATAFSVDAASPQRADEPFGTPDEAAEVADFGDVEIGEVFELPISLDNDDEATLHVVGAELVPSHPALDIATDGCSGESIPPGGSCQIVITFAPSVEGEVVAELVVTTLAGTSSIAVVGNGVDESSGAEPPMATAPEFDEDFVTGTEPGDGGAPPETAAQAAPPATDAPLVGGADGGPPEVGAPPPPPPPPPPTAPPVDQVDADRLRECERRAQRASVAIDYDDTMTLGRTHRFELVATLLEPASGVTTTTVDPPTTVAVVQLRCEVEARLRGADFDIDPGGFEAASFLDQDAIEWTWDVVPRSEGSTVLTVEIQSIAVIDGRRIVGGGKELYERDVTVDPQPMTPWERSKRISEEVLGHPAVKGLGSVTIVLGACAGAWRWLLKRPWPWRSRQGDGSGQPYVSLQGEGSRQRKDSRKRKSSRPVPGHGLEPPGL